MSNRFSKATASYKRSNYRQNKLSSVVYWNRFVVNISHIYTAIHLRVTSIRTSAIKKQEPLCLAFSRCSSSSEKRSWSGTQRTNFKLKSHWNSHWQTFIAILNGTTSTSLLHNGGVTRILHTEGARETKRRKVFLQQGRKNMHEIPRNRLNRVLVSISARH